ncbi:MAG: YggS family pyridoxal phosphate-dependent enzyme [Acidimicrobiales bacterium]
MTDDALARVRERIAHAGGDPDRVRIVAVTKGHPVERVAQLVASGLVDIGESYAQELVGKAEGVTDLVDTAVRWHFIGNLQRNKVRQVAGFVHLWQSVDRLSLAAEVAHRAPGASVLVQVNVARQEQQGGCPPERVAAVVEGCRDLGLDVRGLMAIGPQGAEGEVRAAFRTVRTLADDLALPERSMGMSGDLEAAVAEGSTMVRIGTDLVGPR